jgi:hypothetical protein
MDFERQEEDSPYVGQVADLSPAMLLTGLTSDIGLQGPYIFEIQKK